MKKLSRFAFTALLFNLALFTFASGSQEGDARDSRSGGRSDQERPEQDRPMPSESELTLVRLQSLAETDQNSITLSEEQAETIIPILEMWLETVSEDPESESDSYVKQISSELTEEQNQFLPPPPGKSQGERPEGGKQEGGKPPENSRPEKMEISEQVAKTIEALKKV